MYIFDFLKNLFRKSNIGTIIWMILNTTLICLCVVLFSDVQTLSDTIKAIVIGLIVYLLSILIALSPIGEWIMRMQNGCREIKSGDVLNRMMPIFNEVYAKAKGLNPELPNNIKLYMSDDTSPNAFAMGRHTVCFTRGLLLLSDDDIAGIIGHEFGHLAHKDTDILLVMSVGNLIVSILFVIWRVLFNLFAIIMNFIIGIVSDSIGSMIAGALVRIFVDFLLVLIMKLWTKLGVLICMSSSRSNEFLADKYSAEIGFGRELINALSTLDTGSRGKDGIWAILGSSHPRTYDRIQRLTELCISN